jgi:hypothetical protein
MKNGEPNAIGRRVLWLAVSTRSLTGLGSPCHKTFKPYSPSLGFTVSVTSLPARVRVTFDSLPGFA